MKTKKYIRTYKQYQCEEIFCLCLYVWLDCGMRVVSSNDLYFSEDNYDVFDWFDWFFKSIFQSFYIISRWLTSYFYIWYSIAKTYLQSIPSFLTRAEDGIDWCIFGILFATSSSMRATKSLLLGTCRNVFCASFFIDILIVFVTLQDNNMICQSSSATEVHKENRFCRRFKPYIFASCSCVIGLPIW